MKTTMRTVVLLTVLCTCCWSALNESHVPTGHSDLNLTDQVLTENTELRAENSRLKTSDRKLKDVMDIVLPLSQQWRASTPKDWSRVLRRLLTRLDTVSVAQDEHSADLQTLRTSTNKLRSRLTKQHAALLSLTQGQDKQQNGLDTLTQGQAKQQTGLDMLTQGQDKQRAGLDTLTQGQAKQQTGLDMLTQETQELRKGNKEELHRLKTLLEEQQKNDVNISHLEKGQNELEKGQDELEKGQYELEKGQDELEKGQDKLEKGQDKLEKGQDELEKGQDKLEKGQAQLRSQLEQAIAYTGQASSCAEVRRHQEKAVCKIWVTPWNNRLVFCDGLWTVIQRRQDGSVDFYRDWHDYKIGFGNITGEYWLGLETIHQLTSSGSWQLRVDLEDWEGKSAYSLYSGFSVGPETDNYRLRFSKYLAGTAGDSLTKQNGQQFTTKDRDHDKYGPSNCASEFKAAWWYNDCHHSSLNGQYKPSHTTSYAQGLIWYHWKKYYYSLKQSVMKIRPV